MTSFSLLDLHVRRRRVPFGYGEAPRTVRLPAESYALLEQEAKRRGMEPDALVDELLRAGLAGAAIGDLDTALTHLAELRSHLPDIDGVALAREAGREIEQRDA